MSVSINSGEIINEATDIKQIIGQYFKESGLAEPFQNWILALSGKNPYTYGKKFQKQDGSVGYRDTPFDKEIQYLMAATELVENYKKCESKLDDQIKNATSEQGKQFYSQLKASYKIIGNYLAKVKSFAQLQADLYIRANNLLISETKRQVKQMEENALQQPMSNIETMNKLLEKLH